MSDSAPDHSEPPVAAILAGGESRRMGRDKATLDFGDSTFLEHVVRAAEEAVEHLLVVGRPAPDDDHKNSENLDAARPLQTDLSVTFLEDERPDMGPLGGLATALRHAGRPVVLLACDMPLLDGATVQWLVDAWMHREQSAAEQSGAEHSGADGLVCFRDRQTEPFFSVYAPSILPTVDRMLDDERLALRDLLEQGQFDTREAPPWIARRLVNVNTPEDYQSVARGPDDATESPFPFWQNAPK